MAEPGPPRNNTITRILPSEILFFQILPRLPVTSVPNAMCVCKKWYLFLKSGAFASAYHHHVLTDDDHQNHHKQLVLSTTKWRMFNSIDCETPQDGLSEGRYVPYFLQFHGTMSILASLHGLLCVGTTEYEHAPLYEDLILWNPLTGDFKKLPKPKKDSDHHKECYKTYEVIFGLYYISSDDDYRLLCATHDHLNTYIYSLKSNSWRKVETTTEDFQQRASNLTSSGSFWEVPRHILLDEKLYFLKQVIKFGTFIQSYSVMMFDTKTEKFTEIEIPSFGNQMTNCLGFMVLRGCIHFCVAILIEEENYMGNRRCYEMIEFWRMDGDGDWTKVLTYGPMSFFVWGRSMLHLMRNGNLLIQNQDDVYQLDMKKHTKEMLFTYESKDYQIPLTGKYIETTVSPKQYVKRLFVRIGLERWTVKSWEEYNAFERDMLEKYGEDITQHVGDDDALWALCQGGRKNRTFEMGSSSNQFMGPGRSPYELGMSPIEYVESQLQLQIWQLQIQMEMERKARKEMQDQIAKERNLERKAREDMQTQISRFMSRFGNHFGNPTNPL